MNKRIKELVEKSGLGIDKYGMVFADRDHNEGVDLDIFIDLLIRECATVAEHSARSFSSGDGQSGSYAAAAAVRALGRSDE